MGQSHTDAAVVTVATGPAVYLEAIGSTGGLETERGDMW